MSSSKEKFCVFLRYFIFFLFCCIQENDEVFCVFVKNSTKNTMNVYFFCRSYTRCFLLDMCSFLTNFHLLLRRDLNIILSLVMFNSYFSFSSSHLFIFFSMVFGIFLLVHLLLDFASIHNLTHSLVYYSYSPNDTDDKR
jgi:hypothetical protein